MKKRLQKCWQMILVLVLCVTMLVPSASAFYATENVEPKTTVYDSKEELFSAMRKALLPREKVDVEFAVTDRLRDELCYYDELYHQYFLKGQIVSDELVDNGDGIVFDFYGNQMGIPAKEGDYLIYNVPNASVSHVNHYSSPTTISFTASMFLTTAAQEKEFDAKLASLFAAGGALAHTKSLSKAEAVVECMKYINANVKSVSSYQDVDHSGYGALCKGQATCEGKSLLLYRLLRELGIPNRILMGTDAAAHTYNIVMIDGKYYYTDPSTSNVILKGSNNFKPAPLQAKYMTNEFKAGVLSKISATDYPLPSSSGGAGTGGSQGGGSQSGSTTQKPSTTPSTTPSTNGNQTSDTPLSEAAQSVEYKVLDGAESTYEANATEFSLRAEGALEKFVSIEVDGKEVDKKYYTVKEGSTIVIFTKEFMDTLSEGEHVVTFNFTDGKANANIKVAAKAPATEEVVDESTEAVTGEILEDSEDDSKNKPGTEEKEGVPGYVWVILVVVVLAAGVASVIWYRKKNEGGSEE